MITREKMKAKKKKGSYFEKLQNNNENGPEKILRAARKVFAGHTYNSASIRMLADEAGVDHSLILYHFGSKENLFEVICRQILEEVNQANESWFEGLEKLPGEERLPLYLDRLIVYAIANPEPFKIIAINTVQAGTMDVPGYEYITKNLDFNQRLLEERFPKWKDNPVIRSVINSFSLMVITYIGAKESIAKMQGLDPESREYIEFVKMALLTIFQPLFMQISK